MGDTIYSTVYRSKRRTPKKSRKKEAPPGSGVSFSSVPPSYGHPNETPLRVEVRPGPQVIDLEVQ
jgi:hypothetical protein